MPGSNGLIPGKLRVALGLGWGNPGKCAPERTRDSMRRFALPEQWGLQYLLWQVVMRSR